MKPDFALDLSHDGIRLLFRARGGWQRVGEVALDDPAMSEHLAALRQTAESLVEGPITTKLVIPNSQILYTTLQAPGPDDTAREVQIRVALEGMTPYAVSDLVFDWRADGDTARVAVLAQETMDEAEGFAAQFGFNPVSFVARPENGSFSGEPFFGSSAKAAGLIPKTDRLVPDTSPVPKTPRQMDLPGTASPSPDPATSAPETPATPATTATEPSGADDPTPAPMPGPASTAEPGALDPFPTLPPDPPEEAPEPSAPTERTPSVDTLPKPDADTPRPSAPTSDRPDDTPPVFQSRSAPTGDSAPAPEAPRVSAPRRDAPPAPSTSPPIAPTARREQETVATPVLAPFPPTPDDASDPAKKPAFRPVMRSSDVPEPSTPPRTAAPTPDPAPSTPAFTSRRQNDPSDEVASQPAAPVAPPPPPPDQPQPPETDFNPSDDGGRATFAAEPAADTAPSRKVLIDDTAPFTPKMSGDAEKRRLAMARALGHGPDEDDGARIGSRFGKAIAGAGAGLGRFADQRRARAADRKSRKAEKKAPPEEVLDANGLPPVPRPDAVETEATPQQRRGLIGRKAKANDPASGPQPDSEAEALTVFGARQGQSTGKRRSSVPTGVTLTLLLLLLLAGAALWSTFYLEDEDVALFNPDTGTAPPAADEPTSSEPAAAETQAADPAMMSAEEAAEVYASTGVWERAPETPDDPEAAREDDVYIASIDPTVSATDALALPDPGNLAMQPPVSPTPPPPPGTSFDLNEDGLVIATPEGAVSPAGTLVTRGRPAVTPAPRPEGLVPAPEVQEDAALVPGETALPGRPAPRERPENLAELTERSRLGGQSLAELAEIRPRERPEALDIDVAVAAAAQVTDEAPAATLDETSLASATDLAVAASMRPSGRPGNMQQLVAQARDRAVNEPANDDGSQVIAASAATTRPAIPSSASVARTATMKNALNLRKINLIGVYGAKSTRRALVRMSSGRYVKVSVGDRLDGGQVTSISDTRLTYQKGGRHYALDVLPLG